MEAEKIAMDKTLSVESVGTTKFAAENLIAFFDGKTPPNLVQ
ncbi:MAG: hypothetical protein Q7S52_05525 [bacterium]|nr:hypothetical protein [bacterium]